MRSDKYKTQEKLNNRPERESLINMSYENSNEHRSDEFVSTSYDSSEAESPYTSFDRRETAREKARNEKKLKKEAKKAKFNKFTRILSIIYIVLVALFVWLISWLDVLPGKYYYPMLIVLGIITILSVPAMFSKRGKIGRKIIATLLSFAMIFGCSFGSYYMAKTIWLLSNITEEVEETDDYHIISYKSYFENVLAEMEANKEVPTKQSEVLEKLFGDGEEEEVIETALYENISDIEYLGIGTIGSYMGVDRDYSEAKALLSSELNVDFTHEESVQALVKKFKAGEIPYIFLPNANYESIKAEDEEFEKIALMVYSVKMPIETETVTDKVDVTSESFNILILGIDELGKVSQNARTRSDVNMIVTVNPVKHEVLITSIPRDYHIKLHSKQAMDKLTHASLYGVSESIETLEDTFGIDINYYLRVNFSTIMDLVDAIGGVDVNSDYDFTTSGMKGTTYLNGIHFVKGTNHLDGAKALAFCRERHSFSDGDMQRNKNQQKVIEAIIKKATKSSTILNSYTKILSALNGKMETSMSTDEMSTIIKEQLKSMPDWTINKQSIKSTIAYGYCYSLGFEASIVNQNLERNAEISDAIYKCMVIEKEEPLTEAQDLTVTK